MVARNIPPALRAPLLVLGFFSLVVGVGAGLLRLGWDVPRPAADLAAFHGPLMVCGFFGTVISLERAVALARGWAYLGPLAAGSGGLALILGAPVEAAQWLLALGSAALLAGSVSVFLRQRALFTFTLAAGAASWLAGNLLWLAGFSVCQAVPWWAGFLVLTIAGERLELSRFLPPSPTARRVFVAVLWGLTFGMALSAQLFGAALLALALWLLRQDIARRTVKDRGLTRFIAVCLLSGYAWLFISGAIMLEAGLAPGSAAYDAALHALMLGFVFAMVFGHAPVIFPAVLRVAVPYHPVFYAPLVLLHLSLVARLAGDLAELAAWRSAGGLLNAAALAFFILNTVAAVIRGRLKKTN
ncbi:MAG: hypothetical protein FJY34_05070 [Betaproteobacteria bacterium]|nr:hypothetical protein [Betaproteobacteria bacterium]